MPLLTKKQFADLTNMQTKQLSVYIKRKKVTCENDLIDPDTSINKAFLAKFGGTKAAKGAPKSTEPKSNSNNEETETNDEPDEEGINPYHVSDKRYKHFAAAQKEKAVIISDMEIARKKGQLISPDPVKLLFQQHNMSILAEFKNLMDDSLRYITKQYDIPLAKVAEIKGNWLDGLNQAMDRAKKTTSRGLKSIIDNYAESK